MRSLNVRAGGTAQTEALSDPIPQPQCIAPSAEPILSLDTRSLSSIVPLYTSVPPEQKQRKPSHRDPPLMSVPGLQDDPLDSKRLMTSGPPKIDPFLEAEHLDDALELEPDNAEIDPEIDPLACPQSPGDVEQWAAELADIRPLTATEASPEAQREQVRRIVTLLRKSNQGEISVEEQASAESLLANLPSVLRNPEAFVSGSFLRHYPAWEELIGKTGRKSSRQVLNWLREGVRPTFARERPGQRTQSAASSSEC